MSVLGRPVSQRHPLPPGTIGSLIEGPSYYPSLTGKENLAMVASYLGLASNRVQHALATVNLVGQENKQVKHYSMGMKQRLGLAMALLADPPLMLLDEPTNGLDPAGVAEIRELIVALARQEGVTVIVSSHILSEIEQMADIVGIAAGRFDTGSSLADVQTQSELLRRAIDRARQEGREQDFRPWFDQASAHINALLRGAAAVEGPGRGDRDEPEYMRLVDCVNDGSYDNRVEDIFPIINVALQEARRQGRDGEYRSRIQQAADRLSKLLGGFGSEAGSRPQSGEGTPEPEKTEPVQESAAQAGESADAGGEDAGEEELPPYMQEVKKVLDGFYDEDPAEAQSIVRSAAMSAAEDGRSEEFEDMLGAASDRVDTLLGGRDERQPASEGELPPYMQAVQGVLEGAYDSDPRAMLAIVRRAAQLAEQEGRLEEYGDMISAASARVTGIMRQGQADGAENPVDVTDGDGRALPSYMEAVQDVLRGRYDNDPGAVLVIVRRAAEQAAREGRQEEFADMLQAASDRFAMLMHRTGPGRRDFGQPDWLTALQDVVRGAYDDDPARMESLVRWAADRAAEEGQMGRVRGLIEEAARRVRAVSRRNGSFWDAF